MAKGDGMRVTFYQRCPQGANFSIERVFADIRRSLPDGVDATVAVSHFASRGFFRRIYNIIEAAFRQGDANHITGDVHFLAFFLRKKKTLLTILDLVSVHRLKGWRRAMFLFFWYWLPIKRAAVVSVISESTKNELFQYIKIDPHKVRIVHLPVSADFQPVSSQFNSTKPVILQLGTRSNKNVERVAQAIQGISCHLRVIGNLNDDQLTVLRHCGTDYSSVSNISNEQVVDEYSLCDMLIFASTYEGFGLPILEAQATGRPVVTSNIMSMPEVAGDAACLVDPFDISSIREGIQQIINNPAYREELVQRGFENVERFRPEKIAQKYANIYRLLMVRHWTNTCNILKYLHSREIPPKATKCD
jgi:glycosyltransferase involved in cell wall biosynthesis